MFGSLVSLPRVGPYSPRPVTGLVVLYSPGLVTTLGTLIVHHHPSSPEFLGVLGVGPPSRSTPVPVCPVDQDSSLCLRNDSLSGGSPDPTDRDSGVVPNVDTPPLFNPQDWRYAWSGPSSSRPSHPRAKPPGGRFPSRPRPSTGRSCRGRDDRR